MSNRDFSHPDRIKGGFGIFKQNRELGRSDNIRVHSLSNVQQLQ